MSDPTGKPPIDPMGPPPVVTRDEAAARALHLLHRLLHHRRPGESVKAAIGRAATLAGMDYERARECWYGRALVLGHEIMQLEARVAQREARVARLLDRLAGMMDAPALPPDMRMADALALADLVPGVEPWARSLGHAARALVVVCLLSLLPSLFFSEEADARQVRQGGPAAVKLVKSGARAAGPLRVPFKVPLTSGVRHA